MGAIALPTALNEYTEQYSRLLMQLYLDESFRQGLQSIGVTLQQPNG